ncbi:DUF636 domain protein [Sclerotinia borealis F-4128]|uniref:DUF636 domain protein n=1 Tax=Sclerotinia borealis (strain F-4128) TaxID=1432307 RepID=W9CCH5_SCLBF|nr:DUF636 domain protein [Sclerotinia borealis F-4128]
MPQGFCLCGELAYEYTGEPAITALCHCHSCHCHSCHCHSCQKWCGAISSNVLVPRAQFTLLKGTPKTFEAPGNFGKINKRSFCFTCGTSLFGELEIMPDFIGIKAGALDGGVADYKKVMTEFYTDERLSFCKALEGAKQEPKFGI